MKNLQRDEPDFISRKPAFFPSTIVDRSIDRSKCRVLMLMLMRVHVHHLS